MAAAASKLAEEVERERKREAIRARIAAARAGKAEGEVGGQAGGGQQTPGDSEKVRSTEEEEGKERKRCTSSFSLLQHIVSSDSVSAFCSTCVQTRFALWWSLSTASSCLDGRWATGDDRELLALSTEVIGIVNLGTQLPKFAMTS